MNIFFFPPNPWVPITIVLLVAFLGVTIYFLNSLRKSSNQAPEGKILSHEETREFLRKEFGMDVGDDDDKDLSGRVQ